ncbi:MAG: nitrile hydratase accessory protein [Pseudomonadota bacterium]
MSGADKEVADIQPALPIADDELVFRAPWEAQAFAMAVALNENGLFSWDEFARELGAVIAEEPASAPEDYYRLWLRALERILKKKSIVSRREISKRKIEWEQAAARTPHGQPIVLD